MCVDKYVCADLPMELITAGGCDNHFYEKVERIQNDFLLVCVMMYGNIYAMFDVWYSVLMQHKLFPACLLASIQHAVSVLSSFFPVSVENWHVFFFFTFSFFVSVCLTFLSLSFAFSLIVSLSRPLSVFYFFFFFFILISLQSCHIIFLVIPMWPVYAPSPCILHFSVNILSVFLSIPATSLPPPPLPLYFSASPSSRILYFHLIFPLSLPSLSALLSLTELFQRCLEYFWLCDSSGQHYWHPGDRAWGK